MLRSSAHGAWCRALLRSPLSLRRFSSTLPGVGSDSSVLDAIEGEEHLNRWENKVVATLRTYKGKHGNLLVPFSYVVPIEDDSWPSVARGYKLGAAVNGLRNSLNGRTRWSVSTNMEKELDVVGFVRNAMEFKWDATILPSLEVFSQEFGHCLVGRAFYVPEDPKWPRTA